MTCLPFIEFVSLFGLRGFAAGQNNNLALTINLDARDCNASGRNRFDRRRNVALLEGTRAARHLKHSPKCVRIKVRSRKVPGK